MSETETAEKVQTEAPQEAPKGNVTVWNAFEEEMDERAKSFAAMLPSNVPIERFKNAVIAAMKQNPDLLHAEPRSLFSAITRAAQDGLIPDGREGVITIYNIEIKPRGKPSYWEKVATWNPMAHGLRRRLRDLDKVIANAEVVHERDHFVWHQGDDPKIEHEPAKLGTSRGQMIGAYAIFKREDGTILHREVMDRDQIEKTREQSKAKESLMWTKFSSEGYRKSVLRRGIKTVPVTDQMAEIIKRDDEANFEFRDAPEILVPPPAPAVAIAAPPAPPTTAQATPAPAKPGRKKGEPRGPKKVDAAPAPQPEPEKAPETTPVASGAALPGDWPDYLEKMEIEIKGAKSANETQQINDTFSDAVQGAVERGEISGLEAEAINEAWEKLTP